MSSAIADPRDPPPASAPVHLVTGFLGAGKTTFLNRLLRDPALSETLVVVNEFGAAALDHLLYERLDGEIALLASGCLCCALRGDFAESLRGLLARREAGELAFRRIVVETSGLADPGPILHALFADPTLAAGTRLANVTTLIDAVNGLATLERHGEARRQAALADRLVLTKTDLAPAAPLREPLARLAPTAAVCAAADLDAAAFLAEFQRPPGGFSPRAAHGVVETRVFRSAAPIAPARFERFLALLGAFAGPGLLRIKGLVATADAPERPWLVQGAQHAIAPPLRLAAWPKGAKETSLTLIGEDVAAAQTLWDALTGATAPDAPDWAALADNPLAPATRRGLLG
jgi:G3E family GTPase